MHTFKRWLNKLFPWWPWTGLTGVDKPNLARDVGWNIPPEGTWRSTAHGIEPSKPPGSISIAVEQQSQTNNNTFPSSATSTSERNKPCIPFSHPKQNTTSNTECHLQFLRYLVQRGTFNDDLG